ncbi:hypothetical protein G6F59_018883 [Rhizopus arrhizus]|nr:hypothetical protein G6F59_018883 [Rhizopus arrhizus]
MDRTRAVAGRHPGPVPVGAGAGPGAARCLNRHTHSAPAGIPGPRAARCHNGRLAPGSSGAHDSSPRRPWNR